MTAARDILILGTDEAGYGPNLGPMLVAASCWRAPAEKIATSDVGADASPLLSFTADDAPEPEWSPARLADALKPISSTPRDVFPLLDSKKLYGASKSLAALERPFLVASALLERDASSMAAILRDLRCEADAPAPPWEHDVDLAVPIAPKSTARPLDPDVAVVRDRLELQRVALLELRARRVQPLEFNALLDRLALKSDLVADVTTSLVVETLAATLKKLLDSGEEPPRDALVLCDKLGGRDRYSAILRERFCGADVQTLHERRDASVYRLTAASGRDRAGTPLTLPVPMTLEIRFTAKGESHAPSALASIVAKYLRELSMRLFNEYWRAATANPELAPTAGYPVDALRFRADVDDARRRLGIPDDAFWRRK